MSAATFVSQHRNLRVTLRQERSRRDEFGALEIAQQAVRADFAPHGKYEAHDQGGMTAEEIAEGLRKRMKTIGAEGSFVELDAKALAPDPRELLARVPGMDVEDLRTVLADEESTHERPEVLTAVRSMLARFDTTEAPAVPFKRGPGRPRKEG
jgi:hypothetical protein